MSSLLQNVLASRLAAANLSGDQNESNVSSSSTSPNPMGPPSAPASASASGSANAQGLEDWETLDDINGYSDEELVGVMSAPGTVPGTPLNISRPTSPGPAASKTRCSALSQSTSFLDASKKSKTDPLRSLPREVSQRIFLSLPISSLISLSLVNKRYRRSATLNYCWYRQCHSSSMEEAFNPVSSTGGAKWTRRESKIDWKSHYAKQRRMEAREAQRLESLPGSGTVTPSRTQRLREEGTKTPREMREEEWSAQESAGYTKGEMREWYKSQGGSKGGKIRGKTGKGGVKTGMANDGSLWE